MEYKSRPLGCKDREYKSGVARQLEERDRFKAVNVFFCQTELANEKSFGEQNNLVDGNPLGRQMKMLYQYFLGLIESCVVIPKGENSPVVVSPLPKKCGRISFVLSSD